MFSLLIDTVAQMVPLSVVVRCRVTSLEIDFIFVRMLYKCLRESHIDKIYTTQLLYASMSSGPAKMHVHWLAALYHKLHNAEMIANADMYNEHEYPISH